MALETMKDVLEIGGFKVKRVPDNPSAIEKEIMPSPVMIDDVQNIIAFQIQDGPIGENGVNGCQVDTLIEVAVEMIRGLNKKFGCRENSCAITHLDEALHWLKARKVDRVKRGVEGTDQV